MCDNGSSISTERCHPSTLVNSFFHAFEASTDASLILDASTRSSRRQRVRPTSSPTVEILLARTRNGNDGCLVEHRVSLHCDTVSV
jgi:hypothetical protein